VEFLDCSFYNIGKKGTKKRVSIWRYQGMIQIDFDVVVFQEGKTYVAYSPKLDLSSCGDTVDAARKNLKTAARLFLEEAANMGTIEEILKEAGYEQGGTNCWLAPRIVATELMHLEA